MALSPWIAEGDVDWTGVDPGVVRADQIDYATDILFELAGRQFGPRTTIERPGRCLTSCSCGPGVGLTVSTVTGAPVVAPAIVTSTSGEVACRCNPTELNLAGRPVTAIASVLVDGVPLAQATNWVVFDRRTLVRMDGGTWPCCQDRGVPPPGRLQVTYTWGLAVPPSGKRAAAALAREYALLADPGTASKCRLPRTVRTLTRQGATIDAGLRDALMDDKGMVRIGIEEVDHFLTAKNPDGRRRRRPVIASPDVPGYAAHTPVGP